MLKPRFLSFAANRARCSGERAAMRSVRSLMVLLGEMFAVKLASDFSEDYLFTTKQALRLYSTPVTFCNQFVRFDNGLRILSIEDGSQIS